MADLSSILGGMVQGIKDFGTGLVDMFGTGGAAIGDAIESIRTGRATNRNQDDFRKWLYQTDNTQDAAAKGLGTILNGVQTVSDFIPGAGAITRNPLFNGVQGAIGGVADEFKMAGKDYDLGRAAQRAGVGAASGLASAYTNQALGKTGNKLINNGLVRGAAGGALAGGIANAGYTGIEGGSVQDMINAGLYGAQTGALVGGTTGLARELIKPNHKMDVAFTDEEKAARIANIDDQLGKLDLSTPEGNARYNELMDARQKYSGNKRLYRGLTQEYDANYPKNKLDTNGYESWTDNPELAKQYGEYVYYIDVPEGDIKTSYLDENPMSETYGDRNPIYSIDKKAGLNGVSGNEYLLSVDDPYKQGLTYNKMAKPTNVADLMAEKKTPTNVAELMAESKPKTYYHGSPETDITEFDINRAGKNTRSGEKAIYFTDTPEAAEEFAYERIPTDSNFIDKAGKRGGVYEANLDIHNTLDLDNLTDAQIKELWPYASYMGSWQGEDVFARDIKHWRDVKNPQLIKGYLDLEKLANSPYDSLSATMYPNTSNKAKEYAIFDASKAKITKSPKTVADLMAEPKQKTVTDLMLENKTPKPLISDSGEVAPGYYVNQRGKIFEFTDKYESPSWAMDRPKAQVFRDVDSDYSSPYANEFVDDIVRARISEGSWKRLDLDEATLLKNLEQYLEEGHTLKGTNRAEERFLSAYTHASGPNTYLRNGGDIANEKMASTVKNVMDRTVGTTGTFYRGLNSAEAANTIKGMKVGDIYTDKGFLSTDWKKESAKKFTNGGVLLEITNNSKKPGTNLSLAPYTHDFTENEMLFAPNTKMRIKDIKKEGNITVYKMEVVPPQNK